MQLYSQSENYKLYQGNMLDMLEVIEPNSIDAVVTDAPYELGFMGKDWDSSGIAFRKETWQKCLQVLKPGGHLLCFGGSRTFHRIACAIEDAGFEIRDTIFWMYGSGMPKSMNIGLAIDRRNGVESKVIGSNGTMPDFQDAGKKNSKNKVGFNDGETADRKEMFVYEAQNEWNGWGTTLKPSYESIIMARKPCEGTCIDNVLKWGVGGINIDECRVSHNEQAKYTNRQPKSGAVFNTETSGYDNSENHVASADMRGRFPANTILTYNETDEQEVCGGFPNTVSSGGSGEKSIKSGLNGNVYMGGWSHDKGGSHLGGLGDSGSAARYFYCAKASKQDRDEGLDNFVDRQKVFNGKSDKSSKDIKDVEQRFTTTLKNIHPSVKPCSLMKYLVRLVTPNGGTVLDPFNGSGSTGKAVMYENVERNKGYKYIGIELTEQYLPIARARIEYAESGVLAEFNEDGKMVMSEKPKKKKTRKLF